MESCKQQSQVNEVDVSCYLWLDYYHKMFMEGQGHTVVAPLIVLVTSKYKTQINK